MDARPLYPAHGILSRNKRPEPERLICSLHTEESRRVFEENSPLCRSEDSYGAYHAEMQRVFTDLGPSFVAAATHLASLLGDCSDDTIIDWLDGELGQQDLFLNKQIAALGATAVELSRLYYGQYVAMLVNLSEHQ